jgi:hypothetical protein
VVAQRYVVTGERTLSCACGEVRIVVSGAPIVTAACYCDDCQAGAAQIEALPGARAIKDADGGTWSALYREDRVRVVQGVERLTRVKLRAKTPTNRVVATCCNSAMMVDFDRGPHWVAMYRPGYEGPKPPLEMRLQTRFAPDPRALPRDGVPGYRMFPLRFIGRLLAARVAMLVGR